MQDKTPMYMMIIVGIVALVGLVVMLTNSEDADTGITGNVVSENTYYDEATSTAVGKIFFTLFLLGIAGYMYFKVE